MLANPNDKGPGVSLPPLHFEAGHSAVRSFLTYMQVNLAHTSTSAPYLRIDPADGMRYTVHHPQNIATAPGVLPDGLADGLEQVSDGIGQAASAAAETASTAATVARQHANNLNFKLNEVGSKVTSFLRQSAWRVQNMQVFANNDQPSALMMRSFSESLFDDDGPAGPARAPGLAATPRRSRADTLQVTNRTTTEVGEFETFEAVERVPSVAENSRREPVDAERWASFFDGDGRVTDDTALREAVFYGGVAPNSRKQAWMYLLGHRAECKADEAAFRAARADEYATMKSQWAGVTARQLENNSALRERRDRVFKDVARTDRDNPFFGSAVTDPEQGTDEGNLKILNDVLCTWCMWNFDLGYVQGMSDICAILLEVLEDEIDTFWCFVGMMDTRHGLQRNFHKDQAGMTANLKDVKTLVQYLDNELMEFLLEQDSGNFFFTFRWQLILYKREFGFDDTCKLWEALWTKVLSPRFNIFVCHAIIHTNREEIMATEGFDGLLAFSNMLSGTMDAANILNTATTLCNHVANSDSLLEHPEVGALLSDRLQEAARERRRVKMEALIKERGSSTQFLDGHELQIRRRTSSSVFRNDRIPTLLEGGEAGAGTGQATGDGASGAASAADPAVSADSPRASAASPPPRRRFEWQWAESGADGDGTRWVAFDESTHLLFDKLQKHGHAKGSLDTESTRYLLDLDKLTQTDLTTDEVRPIRQVDVHLEAMASQDEVESAPSTPSRPASQSDEAPGFAPSNPIAVEADARGGDGGGGARGERGGVGQRHAVDGAAVAGHSAPSSERPRSSTAHSTDSAGWEHL